MQKETMILIDGHSLLFKAFFGVPSRILGKDGNPICGILGFTGILLKIMKSFKPQYMLVVFDSERGSFRKEVLSNYKAGRLLDYSSLPFDQNPFTQLPGIRKVLKYLDWKFCEIDGVEADDVIAAYVRKYCEFNKIIIVSTDSDLFQLVDDCVSVFHPRGKKSLLYTKQSVKEKYGVEPKYLPDYKALMGDKTDNIAGVPKVGHKTAGKLIAQFGTIEHLYQHATAIEPTSLRERINEYQEIVNTNVSIIRLTCEIDLPYELDYLKINDGYQSKNTMQILRDLDIIV